jgi:N-methylhydantoinase A
MQYIFGVDTGGTCTDCVAIDEIGRLMVSKVLSTPSDFTKGVMNAIQAAAEKLGMNLRTFLGSTRLFLHSTTVTENAIVDGTLANAGLLVNKGFEEILFMTRGAYGRTAGLAKDEKKNPVRTDKPQTLIPLLMIRGVNERTDYKGQVIVKADEAEIEKAVEELVGEEIEAIGVCFLWSFQNPDNENSVKKLVQRLYPELFFTASNELAPTLGEYERTSTVALNIRLGPLVSRYLTKLENVLKENGFRGIMLVMQAYGGLLPSEVASARPVGMVESGPVSGLVGSKALGNILGFDNIIAVDMGGTTFKAGVVREGLIEYQREQTVLRYHYVLPKMDIVSIGLAGGSIISVDPLTSAPHIGPKSAGAYPGPVCYGFGAENPTVTDIDLLLGYLNPKYFLEGRAWLDSERTWQVFKSRIADPLGMDVLEAASSVYRLANSLFYDLLHKTTVEKGLDPRGYVLFSYGGTAGMHLGTVAQELGVKKVIVPYTASVQGAYGLISADIVHEEQITRPMRVPAGIDEVNHVFKMLIDKTVGQLKTEGFKDEEIMIQLALDMRYRRQIHVVTTPVRANLPVRESDLEQTYDEYERMYEERYAKGSAYREAGMEIVSFRVRTSGALRKPKLKVEQSKGPDAEAAFVEYRKAYFSAVQGMRDTKCYDFEKMLPGNEVDGPSVIWTPITTIVVNPGQKATVDLYRNVVLTW